MGLQFKPTCCAYKVITTVAVLIMDTRLRHIFVSVPSGSACVCGCREMPRNVICLTLINVLMRKQENVNILFIIVQKYFIMSFLFYVFSVSIYCVCHGGVPGLWKTQNIFRQQFPRKLQDAAPWFYILPNWTVSARTLFLLKAYIVHVSPDDW